MHKLWNCEIWRSININTTYDEFEWLSFVLVCFVFFKYFFFFPWNFWWKQKKHSDNIKRNFRLSPHTLMKYTMEWNDKMKILRLTSKLYFNCVFSSYWFCVLIILLLLIDNALFKKDLQGAGHNISAATVIQLRVSTKYLFGYLRMARIFFYR